MAVSESVFRPAGDFDKAWTRSCRAAGLAMVPPQGHLSSRQTCSGCPAGEGISGAPGRPPSQTTETKMADLEQRRQVLAFATRYHVEALMGIEAVRAGLAQKIPAGRPWIHAGRAASPARADTIMSGSSGWRCWL